MAEKRWYRVAGTVTISCFTDVEASSSEEAYELAEERPMQGLCHQCSGGDTTIEWSLSGELDGEATADDVTLIDAPRGRKRWVSRVTPKRSEGT